MDQSWIPDIKMLSVNVIMNKLGRLVTAAVARPRSDAAVILRLLLL